MGVQSCSGDKRAANLEDNDDVSPSPYRHSWRQHARLASDGVPDSGQMRVPSSSLPSRSIPAPRLPFLITEYRIYSVTEGLCDKV